MKSSIMFSLSLYVILTSLASAKIFKPLDDLNDQYVRDIRGRSAKAIQQLSLTQYQEFVEMDVNSYELNPHFNTDSKKPVTLTQSQAEKTLKAASSNPVVSLHSYNKYDPMNQGIGFCFGRAMFIDLYLTLNGLNRASIKKAFVVGHMSTGDAKWGWHVTTIVQSHDRNNKEIWLAIDPIMGKVMEVREWYKECLRMSTDGKLRLYITDAGKFSQMPTRYDEQSITVKFYNNYFSDMMRWFSANDVSTQLRL